ncbi:terminase large subunit domain-containing protein [Ignatzschineria cameli]|uniref:Terminase n=1 Tax=Ignatzschineria cameli TaxID=2182793 RepID=A0ABX5L0S9_9GAMM|nr:terminase family protein [Ignatzschineria cameli]PWD90354.1 hypothetical protein DC079_04225 [Ignatzschineria cameli]PWD92237.1 hypothetical protein DC081_03930 [Ignatzschineria cameli]PWD93031.1 hypothetical protein DC078_04225 [Ignatzschineria cameli]
MEAQENRQSRLAKIFEEKQYDVPEYDPKDVLLYHQRQWLADESFIKYGAKGRRTGLTWAEGADAVLRTALSKKAGGMDYFYVGSDKDMAREFIDACADWANAFAKAVKWMDSAEGAEIDQDGDYFEDKDGNKILKFTITFESGFKIHALSSNPKNFRGRQGNVCIDEAAFHEQFEEVLKAALALRMWGGRIRVISSHDGITTKFYEITEEIKKGIRKNESLHTIPASYAVACGLYKRICESTNQEWSQEAEEIWFEELFDAAASEDDALEEYEAIPKASSGAAIDLYLIMQAERKEHVVRRITAPNDFMTLTEEARVKTVNEWLVEVVEPLMKLLLSEDERHGFGMDFARKGDLSVITLTAVAQDTKRKQRIVLELKNMPFNQQKEIVRFVGKRVPRLVGMAIDSTGNGASVGEQASIDFGSEMVEQVHLTDKYYSEWMPKYIGVFDAGGIEIPMDDDIERDHRKIVNIKGVNKIEKGTETSIRGGKRHGDAAVSGFLSYRATLMEGGVIEFTPLTASYENDGIHEIRDRGCW